MQSVANTKESLAPQSTESRHLNIEHELLSQLSKQFSIEIACGCRACKSPAVTLDRSRLLARLTDLGLVGTCSYELGRILWTRFPFIHPRVAADIVASAVTLQDLILLIEGKVGPQHDRASNHPSDAESVPLFTPSDGEPQALTPGE